MASKVPSEKCGTHLRIGKIQENNLVKKSQLDLERDLLRLFQNSLYCDIKLTVNTSYITTHSCVLKTRAGKFYKYIYTEFEAFTQNGISVFNFYNASFTSLQAFIQNIYTNIHTPKAEDSIIKHLENSKIKHSIERNTAENLNSTKVSPEFDLFFTPKCSPTELQKTFAPTDLRIKGNNVVSYYKIVSVDDIPFDDKVEKGTTNLENSETAEEDQLLEQELAEQDELLLSFKTILTKKNKNKQNSLYHSNSSQSTKKKKPKVYRNLDSKVVLNGTQVREKNRLSPWKSNATNELPSRGKESAVGGDIKNQFCNIRNEKIKGSDRKSRQNITVENSPCTSNMDVSTTGCDSGLESSSLCHLETTPRENTVSETSGVGLTESDANNEILNDETISVNKSGSTESSISSEAPTWDGHDDDKVKYSVSGDAYENPTHSMTDDFDNDYENGTVFKITLNEDELSRLDEMERNIKDCEIFLATERDFSTIDQTQLRTYVHSKIDELGNKECNSSDNNLHTYIDEITRKEPTFQLHINRTVDLNNGENEERFSIVIDDQSHWEENANSRKDNYNSLTNNESSNGIESNNAVQNSNLNVLDRRNDDVGSKQCDVQETKTPPCTPKKLKIEESSSREIIKFPESKFESNSSGGVSNYFIDASSLLDEDEIISAPAISLMTSKTSWDNVGDKEDGSEDKELKPAKSVVSNFFYPRSDDARGEHQADVCNLQENERKQGQIIFKNSIPHFSKHEITERLSDDDLIYNRHISLKEDGEQVVPSTESPGAESEDYYTRGQTGGETNNLVASHLFQTPKFSKSNVESHLPETVGRLMGSTTELPNDGVKSDLNVNPLGENYNSLSNYDDDDGGGDVELRHRNESASVTSGGMNFAEEKTKEQTLPRNQGEAWIVSFEDNKKFRGKKNGKMENDESRGTPPVLKKHSETSSQESSGNFYIDDRRNDKTDEEINEGRGYSVEKSSSFGYFLDFGKQSNSTPSPSSLDTVEPQEKEKKNMFSMFIGIDDNTKSLPLCKKPKRIIEREKIFGKTNETTVCDNSSLTANEVTEGQGEVKKSFYMFIESDSPNVKRKQFPKKVAKSSAEPGDSNTKTFLRSQSYTVKKWSSGNGEKSNEEVKSDCDCSSSDNSLLVLDGNSKSSRHSQERPVNGSSKSGRNEPKITAWSETRVSNEDTANAESWLNTKDILVNYTGKGDSQQNNTLGLKKDSTFIKGEHKSRQANEGPFQAKPPNRDSGVGLNQKDGDTFVKLSDMCDFDTHKAQVFNDKMSQSISERSSAGKEATKGTTCLSKSIETDTGGSAGIRINRSLTRLFPNLSTHSLASLSRRDGNKIDRSDIQGSQCSDASTSLQSSVEPSALEISTSETDVSTTHMGSSKLGEDLLRMFLEEIGPDVTVDVAGRRIKAHKCILSSRCQYFAAMLSGGWVESAGNIISLQGKRMEKHRSKLVPFSFDPECYETSVERDILSDTKTKFVPTKNMCGWSKDKRRSRLFYQPAAFQKVYAQLLDRRKRRRLRRLQTNYLRDFSGGSTKRTERESYQDGTGPKSKESSCKSQKRDGKYKKYKKRKDPWYLNSKQCKTPVMPRTYRQMDDDIDHEKQPLGEGEEGEQINMGPNYESWLLMRSPNSGEREVFHAFWKGEGNLKSIRKAQTKMMLSFMDPSVDPCQDFYQFACGNWGHKNPIPKDKAGYDTFEMLRESLDIVLQDLLMEEDNDTMNEATLKTKNLYRSCMNNKILEQRREKPLLVLLESLGGWPMIDPNWNPENFDWIVLMAKLRLYNNDILISEWVGPDIKNSDEYIIQFDQTSLGLPTREYFLEPCNYVYLEAYKNYLIKISTLLGSTPENAKAEAEDLMIFETALAEITSSPDERRNVSELYERMTVSELSETVPEINWVKYLTIVLNREVDPQEPVVMFALRYVQDLVKLLCQTEPRVISNYLLWRFIRHRVNNLDDRFQEAKQHFYYILFGREEAPPRWKNCVAQVNTNMGMGLGAMFVARYFDEKSKNDTLEMTHDIMKSFRQILNHTVWIDNETKRLAIQKVDAMMLRIGYPDFILNRDALNERYAEVNIDPDLYFENTLNILKHLTRAEQDRLGTRVNKSMWNTPPAVVNAYYSRNKNQIMFPAGILQPPFYHRYFPRSLNYGGIGVVIGHEITHGFDDKGRLFDQDGNLHKWWKEPAIEAFHERAQCLIDQYSKYTVTEVGMQIDGVNTQGENIADNGGIKQAFKAYESWLSVHGDKDEVLQGINATNLQLFFLNFAQIWCGTMRPEATRNKLKTAVHSPGKFRVIGTLSNSEDFARVFQCEPGSPMNPIKKCSVWFSYNAVHFALRYIYSGESRIPESLNIVELATLADMLCLDGLQEIISYNLKVKYCHSFHVPCSICSVGVIDCLPIAAAYGLDDLYRKCLRWITRYFVKLWPTKSFGSMPKELHEKCYQHFVVHLTVDNVLDTIVNIDKVRGSLTNVRWAESVSRLIKKLYDAVVRYISDHFSSVLTSDKFLALGKEDGWNISRLEDSLIDAIKYLPPEQACWSHARLHRILSVANGPDPPPEMDWNENFLKLLQIISELVESSLIKQAPRAARSKAWRQLEPELRIRIQEAACLVLPDEEPSPTFRRPHHNKKTFGQLTVPQTAKSRILELRQIKLAMSQQANRNTNTSRPLSLQIDQRPKKNSQFVPLRTSASTSSVRRYEPVEGIRKTQSRSHILGSTIPEPKKTINPRYSEIKSRYLEPKSPQKIAPEKTTNQKDQRRNLKNVSSSDTSRNYSPALRSSNSRISTPQGRKPTGSGRPSRDSTGRSDLATGGDKQQRKQNGSTRSETPSGRLQSRLTTEENMSTDSLCTDSNVSDKEVTTLRRRLHDDGSDCKASGKENKVSGFGAAMTSVQRTPKLAARTYSAETRSKATAKNNSVQTYIMPSSKSSSATEKRLTSGKTSSGNATKGMSPRAKASSSSLSSSPRGIANRNQRNSGKSDANYVNGNSVRRKSEVDSENNKRRTTMTTRTTTKEENQTPLALSRSGTFLKEEPTILKKPQQAEHINGRL